MSEWPGEWESAAEPWWDEQHDVVNIEGNLYLFGDEYGEWLEVSDPLPPHLENNP